MSEGAVCILIWVLAFFLQIKYLKEDYPAFLVLFEYQGNCGLANNRTKKNIYTLL